MTTPIIKDQREMRENLSGCLERRSVGTHAIGARGLRAVDVENPNEEGNPTYDQYDTIFTFEQNAR